MKRILLAAGMSALFGASFAAEIHASLSASRQDLASAHAVLTWTTVAGWAGSTVDVQRRQEDGDWATIASLDGTATTYTDSNALYFGVPYSYRLVCGEDNSESVVYRRIHRIGQNADASLQSGVTVVWEESPETGCGAANSFDGNTATYTEFNSATYTFGLDFGEDALAYVAHVRIYPRANSGFDYRLNGINVYGDNESYAGSGMALSTELSISKGSPDQWHEMVCDATTGYRYVFFYSRARTNMNASEIEIYGWTDADLEAAESGSDVVTAGLSVGIDSATNSFAVLTWQNAAATEVYRSHAPTGPWSLVTTVEGPCRYVDQDVNFGFTYFYRVGIPEGGHSEIVEFHRVYQLERVDATTLASGVQLLSSSGLMYPDQPLTGPVAAFDGNLGTTPEVYEPAKIGVRFDTPSHVALVRIHPRGMDEDWAYQRINGVRIYGSNDDNNWAVSATAVSEPLVCAREGFVRWHQLSCDDTAAYRSFYVSNPTAQSYGNWAEIEFYGWMGDADRAPSRPETVRRSDGSVALSWTCRNRPDRFVVSRRDAGGSEWSELGETTDGTFADTTGVNGTTYAYRVAAVYDDESTEAASTEVRFTFYAPGDGTGLTGAYRANYSYFDYIGEYGPVQTRTDAKLDFNWGTGPLIGDDADNVLVEWTGKLIVPVTGAYQMTMTADDASWLFIDGRLVDSAYQETHTRDIGTLTAGEHDLRVRYAEGNSSAAFQLRWGGAVADEVIPSSQLKPGTPASYALPGQWEGARTFGQTRYGGFVEVDSDGTAATFCDSGEALIGGDRGYSYLYQPISGSFDISFKYDRTGCTDANYQNVLLMVRSGLSNASAFRSLVVRYGTTSGRINVKSQTAGGNVTLLQEGWPTQKAEYMTSGYLRLNRTGNVFTTMIRPTKNAAWETFDTWTDVNGEFGRTVYVGPGFAMGDSAQSLRTGYTARITEIKVKHPAFLFMLR